MRLIASLLVAIVVVVAGCGSTPRSTAGPSVSTFENDIMSFEYPGNWNVRVPETGDTALVLLSTEQLAATEPRIDKLNPDGVYIAFTEEAIAPVATPNPSLSTEVDVGGRPAVVTQGPADGECAGLEGDQLLTIRVSSPGNRPDIKMQACTKGPNLELTSAAIAGMLASITWKN